MKRFSLLILVGITLLSCKPNGNAGGDSNTLSSNALSRNSANISKSGTSSTSTSEGPGKVVEKFVADAEKGDATAMSKAFSKEYVEKKGAEKVNSNNMHYSDMLRKIAASQKSEMFGTKEKINGDKAFVTYNYGSPNGANTGCTAFALIKEDGSWKINDTPDCADVMP